MIVKYKIEVPNEVSADFWKVLTEKFNIILIKKQHCIDSEKINIDVKVINSKIKQHFLFTDIIIEVRECNLISYNIQLTALSYYTR